MFSPFLLVERYYKAEFQKLYNQHFWLFSKEWWDAIDDASSAKDGSWLKHLFDTLKGSIDRPETFPMWYLQDVPEDIEEAAAKTTNTDRYTLHQRLKYATLEEQEKLVKMIIKFWIKQDKKNVPACLKDYANLKPVVEVVETEIEHVEVQAIAPEVIPHGAIASVEYLPKVEPLSLNPETDKVKKILIASSKVRFIGAEGCGKTSKARWLCRERIAVGHKVFWINPHLNANDKEKLLANGVTIIGGGRDYAAIGQFCIHMVDGENSELSKQYERYGSEVGARFESVTFVLDELTNYKDEVGEPIEKFIKSSMQEFSKISWHTVYITHNDTLSCMGAPNGTANLIKSSVFDLRLETDILKGNRVPKAIAKYRMPNSDNWSDVTIPVEWQ